ncbi:hypothetical protein K466DRAFT_126719 [Polyporus arcularius HHB13444]|uniref:Uncharacterized protein n=1 Tax=Polyporus arcularius HHB13444 TaxID=1314778 RepID=A0A5C3NWM6_9APHY|nr:hypothetical protein K466DRAFT_126719 [Polyporus arcularius HHB13444]
MFPEVPVAVRNAPPSKYMRRGRRPVWDMRVPSRVARTSAVPRCPPPHHLPLPHVFLSDCPPSLRDSRPSHPTPLSTTCGSHPDCVIRHLEDSCGFTATSGKPPSCCKHAILGHRRPRRRYGMSILPTRHPRLSDSRLNTTRGHHSNRSRWPHGREIGNDSPQTTLRAALLDLHEVMPQAGRRTL